MTPAQPLSPHFSILAPSLGRLSLSPWERRPEGQDRRLWTCRYLRNVAPILLSFRSTVGLAGGLPQPSNLPSGSASRPKNLWPRGGCTSWPWLGEGRSACQGRRPVGLRNFSPLIPIIAEGVARMRPLRPGPRIFTEVAGSAMAGCQAPGGLRTLRGVAWMSPKCQWRTIFRRPESSRQFWERSSSTQRFANPPHRAVVTAL